MFKSIILVVLIIIVIAYGKGNIVTQWLDLLVSFAAYDVERISTIVVLTGIVAIMVVVGFIVAFSIFAGIAFAFIATCIGLFIAGLSTFWPVILFSLVIFLLVRAKQTPAY